ncbi:MAG TPA: peptide chain release factor N(5)-glutamine methyltransferase [Rhizomicrobium sp.]|nr:peptide chain release factor N(5)-glutamine methyltransferase [Rhizomicrobium sp.]
MNDILQIAAERLRAAGIEFSRADARILFEYASRNGSDFELLLERRLCHEPVAYITGHREFWSLDFEVGPGVLIPRPETETLVEQALRELPERTQPYRILDMGTGSGCLLISLLKEFSDASGVGIDSSDAALSWAKRNVARFGLGNRCLLLKSDWAEADGLFDLVVSNPPYIPVAEIHSLQPDVRDFEPRAALDGGPGGLAAYRAIAPVLAQNLKADGVALLEIGSGQHHLMGGLMEAQGLAVLRIEPDLAGILRCVVVRKAAGKR